MYESSSPLIIGGVGGSGTRVLTQLVIDGDYFMGTNLNKALDSLDFKPIFHFWIKKYLVENPLTNSQQNLMNDVFYDCLSKHLSKKQTSQENWGVKNPRFCLILPFLYNLFPKLKYIHVIRDGRDMAFSSNQNQPRLYGDVFCGKSDKITPNYSLNYWSKVNLMVFDYASSKFRKNFLLIRFEDLVQNPENEIKKIFHFIGNATDNITESINKIKRPLTINRWKLKTNELLSFSEIDIIALKKFGYDTLNIT